MIPSNELELENEIQEKGLDAPRLTPQYIESILSQVEYTTHIVGGTTTVAVAFHPNGYSLCSVISACASPENFNEEIGRKAAIDRAKSTARDKLWELEGYRLKCSLSNKT